MADRRAGAPRSGACRCTSGGAVPPRSSANRERFGGVTLQGLHGLAVAPRLARVGELRGVDLDPAAYLARGKAKPPVVEGQLGFDLDLPVFDWVSRAGRARVARRAHRRGPGCGSGSSTSSRPSCTATIPCPCPSRSCSTVAGSGPSTVACSPSSCGPPTGTSRSCSGRRSTRVDSSYKVQGLRRLLRWSTRTGRKLELLRTGPIGIPAVAAGAKVAAIGLSSSTRHLGGPVARRADGVKPKRSPQVFVPKLLHWQRGIDLRGTEVTHCDVSRVRAGRRRACRGSTSPSTPVRAGRGAGRRAGARLARARRGRAVRRRGGRIPRRSWRGCGRTPGAGRGGLAAGAGVARQMGLGVANWE